MTARAIHVLIDGATPAASALYDWGAQGLRAQVVRGQEDELEQALSSLSAQPVSPLVVLQGPDAWVSRALTCRARQGLADALPMAVMPWHETALEGTVAAALLGPKAPDKAAAALTRGARQGTLTPRTLHTLRVVYGAQPGWRLAFHLGMGQVFALVQERQRGLGRALGGLIASLAQGAPGSPGASRALDRMTLDGRPEPARGYALLSALPKTWFGLAMSERGGARARLGDALVELTADLARSRAPLAALRGLDHTRALSALHVDALQGYVLDGELIAPELDSIMRVTQGPLVQLMTAS